MSRARANPDGLPFRVYERYGLRVYSIGYKLRSGRWAFRYRCPVTNGRQIANLRREAIVQATKITDDAPIGGFAGLVNAWFAWQEKLPESNGRKCAASTIRGNRPEADNLVAAWGHFEPREITRTMGYEYLEACMESRPEKGNKEVALARKILEFGISRGLLQDNPLNDLEKNKVNKEKARRVTAKELALAVEIGRDMGGPYHIVAMALKTAWLCVRRSVEVRAITQEAITDEGMLWRDGKNKNEPAALIEWTDELRETINEAAAPSSGTRAPAPSTCSAICTASATPRAAGRRSCTT